MARFQQEDPSAKKSQDDLKWEVILNPSKALRRGVKNLGVSGKRSAAMQGSGNKILRLRSLRMT
jgi:hypothetical protein